MLARKGILIGVVLSLAFAGCLDIVQTISPELANQRSGPGDMAKDFISGKEYSKLVIELHHPPGVTPNADALADMQSVVRGAIEKSSIQIQTHADAPDGQGKTYTWNEINELEKKIRKAYSKGDTAVMFLLYLNGGSEKDDGSSAALGAAYHGSSMVIFKSNIKKLSRGDGGLIPSFRPDERFVERAVLVHELGHLFGLVNLGTKMVRDHEDPSNKGHSANEESVMYWAVESSRGLETMLNRGASIPYRFDANDLADLNAVKGT
jgi:predicted Zn-dependent protease